MRHKVIRLTTVVTVFVAGIIVGAWFFGTPAARAQNKASQKCVGIAVVGSNVNQQIFRAFEDGRVEGMAAVPPLGQGQWKELPK